MPAPKDPELRREPSSSPGCWRSRSHRLRVTSEKSWGQVATDLKPIQRAPSRQAAWTAFEEFEEKWGSPTPRSDDTVLCSTNAIESLNAATAVRSTSGATSPPSRPRRSASTWSQDRKGTGQ